MMRLNECLAEVAGELDEWRPVVGFEGIYEVSRHGLVRSVDRIVVDNIGRTRHLRGVLLSITQDEHGYMRVGLYRQGSGTGIRVHSLVAAAFIGPRPDEQQVAHNDGDPSNNTVENLRYATYESNQADRIGHGTSNRGERHGQSRLTVDAVQDIRLRRAAGQKYSDIAVAHGVSRSTVADIVKGRRWTHVPLPDCGHAWTTDWAAESLVSRAELVVTAVAVGASTWDNKDEPDRGVDAPQPGSDHLPFTRTGRGCWPQ